MFIAELYFSASILFFGMFAFFFIAFHKTHNRFVFAYSLCFLAMFLFAFSSSVPELLTNDLRILAIANVFSNFFIFCLIFACFQVQLIVTNHFFKKNFVLFNILLGILTLITIYLQANHLSSPEVGAFAIIWHLYPPVMWILTGIGVIYGAFWCYLFGKAALLIEEKELKRRITSFSINGVLYGAAAFCLFTQESVTGQIIALSLFGIGGLLSASVFLLPYVFKFFEKPKAITT